MPDAAAPRRSWAPRIVALGVGVAAAAAIYFAGRAWIDRRGAQAERASIETHNAAIQRSQNDYFKPKGGPPYALKPRLHDGRRLVTNSLGLRSPELAPGKKEPRIFVLGDSFTFGFGLNEGEPFCEVLAERLKGSAEVANGGVSGFQIQDMAAQYLRLAEAVKPDLVVVTFVNNDLNDSDDIDDKGGYRSATIAELPDGFYAGDANLQRIANESWLRGADATRYARIQFGGNEYLWRSVGPFARDRWARYTKQLARIRDDAKERGARVVMFSFYPEQIGLLNACADLEIPYFDLGGTVDVGAKRFQLSWDAHPNAEANRLIADRLMRVIAWTKLVPTPGVEPAEPVMITAALEEKLRVESETYARTELSSWIAADSGAQAGHLGQFIAGIENRSGLLGVRAVALLGSKATVSRLRIEASAALCGGATRTLEVRVGGLEPPFPFRVDGPKSETVIELGADRVERLAKTGGGSVVEVDVRDPVVAAAAPPKRKGLCCVRLVRLELE